MKPETFYAKLAASPRPVIVDLWAPWCSPCKVMEPAVKQMANKYAGQVDIWKINADEAPEVLRSLKVMGIPTMIGYSNGQEIIRKTGVQSPGSLDILFDATLHGRSAVILPPAPADRWIRSTVGLLLIILGWSLWQSPVLAVLGAVVLFSAFYDRCPIFRAVAPRVMDFFKRPSKTAPKQDAH